jgi:hypothetical protein
LIKGEDKEEIKDWIWEGRELIFVVDDDCN